MPRPTLLALLAAAWIALAGTAHAAERREASFLATTEECFAGWDTDHDGTLSAAEVDAAVADPSVKGPAAAAIAAIKRAVRDPKYKVPALTLGNLRDLLAAPAAADRPDLQRMFALANSRLSALTARTLFPSPPRLDTIHQGRIGDCFTLAPLGAMVNRDPAAVVAMFKAEDDGRWRVTFGRDSAVVSPLTDAEIALSSSNENDGLWVNLYEKALGTCLNQARPADQRASEALDALARGGSSTKILSLLTGHEVTRLSFAFAKDAKLGDSERASRLDRIRHELSSATADRRLMTTRTVLVSTPGLTPNHAYALLDYDEKADTVRLWNPHGGEFKPKGETGPDHGYPTKDGIFRMPVSDWVSQFSSVSLEQAPPR